MFTYIDALACIEISKECFAKMQNFPMVTMFAYYCWTLIVNMKFSTVEHAYKWIEYLLNLFFYVFCLLFVPGAWNTYISNILGQRLSYIKKNSSSFFYAWHSSNNGPCVFNGSLWTSSFYACLSPHDKKYLTTLIFLSFFFNWRLKLCYVPQ